MRFLVSLLFTVLLAYVGMCVLLYAFQRALIYFPSSQAAARTAASTLALELHGERLLLTVRLRDGAPALLYFGGNAEDVSLNLPELSSAFPAHAIYLLHYRGYGGSSGRPTEAALQADALALYDRLADVHPDIALVGRSLGGALALRVAAERPVARLVLITPFDSMVGIAQRHYRFVPVRWLMKDRYESADHAPRVRAPTTLLVAGNDEIVPPDSAQRLRARFQPGVAHMQVIAGTGHNTIGASPAYLPALQAALLD